MRAGCRKLCHDIKLSSAQPPFCVPYHKKIFESISVPIQAAYLYDAVMIYARALTEMFDNNEDPRNGTAILQRIVNRSYHSVQGYDVSFPPSDNLDAFINFDLFVEQVFIDGNGDAEGNFTVVALLDDLEMNGTLRMSMQPVGYFQYNGSNSPLSIPVRTAVASRTLSGRPRANHISFFYVLAACDFCRRVHFSSALFRAHLI